MVNPAAAALGNPAAAAAAAAAQLQLAAQQSYLNAVAPPAQQQQHHHQQQQQQHPGDAVPNGGKIFGQNTTKVGQHAKHQLIPIGFFLLNTDAYKVEPLLFSY